MSIKLSQYLRHVLLLGAVLYILVYICVAYYRLQYPFELEWMEGSMVDHVQRIVHGENVYVAPSFRFVPSIYPPLYFYVSAGVSAILGGGFLPLRLVSLAASLLSLGVIATIVQEETKNWQIALLSAGLFAATYRVTGAWLDVARVDSLFLLLWLLFVYFAIGKKTMAYAVIAGVFAAMSFLTKQTALITCLPVIAYLFYLDWKHALVVLTAAISLVGATTLILNYASSGWYTYYVFELMSVQTDWLPRSFVTFWTTDLCAHLPLAILFTVFLFIGRTIQNRSVLIQWLSILVGTLAGSFITRAKTGGYDNVLLPAFAAISILFGVGLNELLKIARSLSTDYRVRAKILIQIACLIQLAMLGYDPFQQIPTYADRNAGYDLLRFISKVDGEVYLADHGYLTTLAGKNTYAHHSPVMDVRLNEQANKGEMLLTENLSNIIRQQYFDVIILDSDFNFCCSEIDKYYTRLDVRIFQDDTAFYPVTGWQRRPTYIYVADRLKQ